MVCGDTDQGKGTTKGTKKIKRLGSPILSANQVLAGPADFHSLLAI
ncbi:hypothetical protein C943_01451 [Mariniradius saccharolyticus AK6]|uniref:Uncharacterized protein n=1 Tax=Mariniradius saccharolyticus AK6 TaxID=1239962 RepID=M7XBB5_9BACT|nr:hypothetical protein C943_01451 [Mariniradius saccharolyticus AK6]